MKKYFILLVTFLLPFILNNSVLANDLKSAPECSQIDNDMERLKCYDRMSATASNERDSKIECLDKKLMAKSGHPSYLSRLWDLDVDDRQEKYSIIPHRSSYFLPFSYNTSPNEDPMEEASPGSDTE